LLGRQRRELEIPEEQFFGRYGSPLAGEGLISMIGNLVRQGPPAEDK
jgi:hypothetical protein